MASYALTAIDTAASTARFDQFEDDGRPAAEVRLEYRVGEGDSPTSQVDIVSVTVELADPHARSITEESLAALHLSRLVEMIQLVLDGWPEPPVPIDTSDWPAGDGLDGMLADVAATYRWARLRGNGPLQAVMEATGASRTTASRMIRDAKMKGLL